MKCRICSEEISDGAKKCVKCGSFQNWRRYLAISNTSISLLIALLSVSSLFITVIDEYWVRDENISVIVIDEGNSYLRILVANSGEKEAIVAPKAFFLVPTKDHLLSASILNESKLPTKDLIIKPGQAKIFTVTIHSLSEYFTVEDFSRKEECSLSFEVINLKGDRTWKDATYSCGVIKK